MALLDAELTQLRYELGYNVLNVGAEPYIGVTALFDQVIKPYLSAGATTTSTTAVTAATTPTPVTLTLASATGFAAGCRVVLDVDGRQENVTVQSVSGSTIVVHLSKAHSGTYPVTVEGGETIVRDLLKKLATVREKLDKASGTAGIEKVEDISFGRRGNSPTVALMRLRSMWRDELASALGVPNLNGACGGGGSITLY